MAYLITSEGKKYIPDHLRITGLEPPPKQAPLYGDFSNEMKEIRAMEACGIIKVDEYTKISVEQENGTKKRNRKGGPIGRPRKNRKNR